jgi:heat shock protein HslJ
MGMGVARFGNSRRICQIGPRWSGEYMTRHHVSIAAWIMVLMVIVLTGCRETAELGETSWELAAYGPADAPILAVAPASIRFEDNGRLSGHTGCNAFSGHYEAEDGRLTFRNNEMAFTTRDCGAATPEGQQDAFFRQWLDGGADYTQTAERLTLLFDDGRQLAEYRLNNE